MYLIVKSEDDGSIILESKVHTDDVYQRQQGISFLSFAFIHNLNIILITILATLIVWSDPDTNIDLALSFQEADGCQDVWYVNINTEHSYS